MTNNKPQFYIDRKRLNDPAFNKKVKKRREKAKFADKSRKINRRKR